MKKWMVAGLALALAAVGQPAAASPDVAVAMAPPPSNARYEADLKALAAWVQGLSAKQSAMADSIDRMWKAFEVQNKVAETASPEEVQRSYQDVLEVIGHTKSELLAEKEQIAAIQQLKGNVILAEIAPGHLEKLQSHALKSADGFLELADRAETQVTAMSLGEVELGNEFSLLMMDSSISMIGSQLNLLQSNSALSKKGSSNAMKMESMVYVYEAMDHLLREQRKVSANETLGVNFTKIKQLALKMRESSAKGLAALKKEKAELKASRAYLTPALISSLDAQHSSVGQWLDYLQVRSVEIDALPDQVNTLDPNDPAVIPVSNLLVEMEAKFMDLHIQMLQKVSG